MEATGLMDICPCLVIRGICDYSDAHKNKLWQPYAAVAAAAHAKELLQTIPTDPATACTRSSSVQAPTPLRQVVNLCSMVKKRSVSSFQGSDHEEMKNRNPDLASQTCRWFFGSPQYDRWFQSTSHDLLWVTADPGCGKLVLAKPMVDKNLKHDWHNIVAYFFFKDNGQQDKLEVAFCALIHQILFQRKDLVKLALPLWIEEGSSICTNKEALWRAITAVSLNREVSAVICVLDGLDECEDYDKLNLISKLTECWVTHSRIARTTGPLKCLVTSRPYDDIMSHFEDRLRPIIDEVPNIRIKGEDENDQLYAEVDRVLIEEVAKLRHELNLEQELASQLHKQLKAIPNRTYLW